MGARKHSRLKTGKKARAKSVEASARRAAFAQPLLYTAQDVARFCEVDLKTIHHWADAGKIEHYRTEGRHLRFRRNHVLSFLRLHGYPIAEQIGLARPSVFLALPPESSALSIDDLAKKLAPRFFVRRFDSAIAAVAHVVASGPDALVLGDHDPTWVGLEAVRALKRNAETSWPLLVVVSADEAQRTAMKDAGADHVVDVPEAARLHLDLARILSVD